MFRGNLHNRMSFIPTVINYICWGLEEGGLILEGVRGKKKMRERETERKTRRGRRKTTKILHKQQLIKISLTESGCEDSGASECCRNLMWLKICFLYHFLFLAQLFLIMVFHKHQGSSEHRVQQDPFGWGSFTSGYNHCSCSENWKTWTNAF